MPLARVDLIKGKSTEAGRTNARKPNMKQTHAIPETFLGVGYTRDRGRTSARSGASPGPAAGGRRDVDPRCCLVAQPTGIRAGRP